MYKTKHNIIPQSCTYNVAVSTACPYNLRKRKDFMQEPFRTNIRKRHISVAGPYVWDTIPEILRLSGSLLIFKRKLSVYLLNQYTAN